MKAQKKPAPARPQRARAPVTKERALHAAIKLADQKGLEAVTMRRLAKNLRVEAMSLYHHVPNKDAILSGMVDRVFAEIELPRADLDWKTALRRRMSSVRDVLLRHPWALRILESRSAPGEITLLHHDAVLGCLRTAGFPIALAARAFSVLDSFVFGFVHTELTLPFRGEQEAQKVAGAILDMLPAGAFPNLVEFTRAHVLVPGYTYGNEFPFGLDLILDGLERELGRSTAR